jgi:hypothetical protein
VAAPEQALFDFIYLMRRRGAAGQSVVTFRNLHKLDRPLLSRTALRYPRTVRKQVSDILLRK